MNIILHPDELKEAVLEYLKTHRSDLIVQDDKPPEIKFFQNGKELETVAVEVVQWADVHNGHHPYR